jgi:hypothetical protein
MPKITFIMAADYDDTPADPLHIQPTVEYSIDIPKNVKLNISEINFYFNNWLRGLGYTINE